MFDAGMTGIRLNLSHSSLETSQSWIQHYFDAASQTGKEAYDRSDRSRIKNRKSGRKQGTFQWCPCDSWTWRYFGTEGDFPVH